jgi:type IV pilus assembly protein PilV
VLEVLVALLLLSLGVIGMAALHARAIQYALDAEDRNRAALLANELSSTMWLNRSTTVASATLTSWQTQVSTVTGNGLPNGSGSVSVDGSGVATITISWRPPSRPSSAGNLQYITKVVLP